MENSRSSSASALKLMRRSARRRRELGRISIGAGLAALVIAACGSERAEHESVAVSRGAITQTLSFQQRLLPSTSYSGVTDATLRENAPANNDGTSVECGADGDNGGGVDKSCVLRWDVSAIPPGSTVRSATMTLHVTNGSAQSYGIHELRRTWEVTQVSWSTARTGQPWATPGANGTTDRGAVVASLSGASGTQTMQLNAAGIARVQAWVDNPSSNAGVIVANTANVDGIDLATSEHEASLRPKLSVTYDTPTGSGGTGAGGSGGTGAGAGGSAGALRATPPELLVAFIGDQGDNADAVAVLDLIASEGAHAVVHNGDFDYHENPTGWAQMIDSRLGANFPYFAVLGNHERNAADSTDTSVRDAYLAMLAARTQRIPEMRDHCTGVPGYETTCNFRGLKIVQSCVGLGEVDRARCAADGDSSINYLRDALDPRDSIWSVCNWHKVQEQMQVASKTNEAGWLAYSACMQAGAIIATAHTHTYSRSLTLTDIANTNVAARKGAVGTHDSMQVGPGRTFVVVTGIGGRSLDERGTNQYPWWASYYTKFHWRPSGATSDTSFVGKQGALFIKFHVSGNAWRAQGYVKDITLRTLDSFGIQAL